jgi:LysM repeat protein
MGRPAKALSGFNRTVGSNPTLSAMQVHAAKTVVLVAILFSVLAQSSSLRAECAPNYVVKRGDSWWSIAESEGVTLRSLLKLNGARTSTLIKPKDQVCVPSKQAESVTYSTDEIVQIIREIWPDELEERAIAIARRESQLRPEVIGIPNECCYGLFQIYYRWHKTWLSRFGVTSSTQLLNPVTNAKVALELYRRSGNWRPWRP